MSVTLLPVEYLGKKWSKYDAIEPKVTQCALFAVIMSYRMHLCSIGYDFFA
jgi:hypothetical protein